MPAEARIRKIALAAIIASALVAAVPFFISDQVATGVNLLKIAADRQNLYIDLLSMLRDVETGQRGYALSALENFLEPYNAALLNIPALKRSLLHGTLDAQELQIVKEIISLTDERLSNAAQSIAAQRTNNSHLDGQAESASVGKAQMDKLRIVIGAQISTMAERRGSIRAKLIAGSSQVAYFSGLAAIINALLLGTAVLSGRRLLKQRAADAAQLTKAIDLADTRNLMMSGSALMLQAIQSVSNLNDTSRILKSCLTTLLPGTSGSVYLYRGSPDLLEPLAFWGSTAYAYTPIPREDCWAMRFGRTHDYSVHGDLPCDHLLCEANSHHICIPMVTQGAVIGLMSVRIDDASEIQFARHHELVAAFAEQVSLALSNVQLREALREQSIVDPLTGLYNRRFLEETLIRELARGTRNQVPVSVIILDVDHFKRINDTFGHDAGDTVLKAVAVASKSAVRKTDIVCRYGGEEIIVVLPECTEIMALERAEAMRKAIEDLQIECSGRAIPQITASFGVASYPVFGQDSESLVQAADTALYVAKHSGRNNVQMAV